MLAVTFDDNENDNHVVLKDKDDVADVWPAVLISITNSGDGSQTVRVRYTNKRQSPSFFLFV